MTVLPRRPGRRALAAAPDDWFHVPARCAKRPSGFGPARIAAVVV